MDRSPGRSEMEIRALEWITEIAIRGKEKVWHEIQNFGRLN